MALTEDIYVQVLFTWSLFIVLIFFIWRIHHRLTPGPPAISKHPTQLPQLQASQPVPEPTLLGSSSNSSLSRPTTHARTAAVHAHTVAVPLPREHIFYPHPLPLPNPHGRIGGGVAEGGPITAREEGRGTERWAGRRVLAAAASVKKVSGYTLLENNYCNWHIMVGDKTKYLKIKNNNKSGEVRNSSLELWH